MKKWKLIVITWFDLTETEREEGLIAIEKPVSLLNIRGSLNENFKNILTDIL